MKRLALIIASAALAFSCSKSNPTPAGTAPAPTASVPPSEHAGAPYGDSSLWKCIGGDTMFTEILKLKHYYTEKTPGCDTYYYEFSYPIWSEYDYHIAVSECTAQKDTLFITDFNSSKIVAFVRYTSKPVKENEAYF